MRLSPPAPPPSVSHPQILDAWVKNVSIWVPFQAFNQGIMPLR